MSILLNNHGYDDSSWFQELSRHFPQKHIHIYKQTNDIDLIRDDIEYAVIWNHPVEDLLNYKNLKGILLLGAGTEHIDAASAVPNVPIIRLIDPEVLKDMGLYTLYWVMNQHRQYDTYRLQQLAQHWQRHNSPQAIDFNITILGLGAVGKEVVTCLKRNGFNVAGWDAFPQELEGINSFSSKTQLTEALNKTHVLVNCLPLNASTTHFINRALLEQLSPAAMLINISRGDIIDDRALIEALDTEHLSHAVLDTFNVEPLPKDSPYWHHPKVTLTPHISGATYARSAAKLIATNIQRIENGEHAFPLHQHPSRTHQLTG
ncbi:glyoxylate/hydroxypyruvate reductase A [Marinomonas sp. S3726]|uniref:2-hydroxyacid dehydrogenase n=1 Tax=Marinomonas sp. S3726 TaxID=579484 RepID=UPI000697D7F0|nr:glyoxylate/hydroxypyruvate reductase A [Marinomonas sp. S3726]